MESPVRGNPSSALRRPGGGASKSLNIVLAAPCGVPEASLDHAMKIAIRTFSALLIFPSSLTAGISNPLEEFKVGLVIPAGDKILKWEADINGDGKNDVLFCLKSDFDADVKVHDTPGWDFYIAEASGTTFTKSVGTLSGPNTISVGDLPQIDTASCFVGQISELGKHGVVTMRIDNPRSGPSVAKIYAYTIEGDHLKRHELAKYDPSQATPHPLFTTYLADGKRTVVQPTELAP